jgi:nucleoside-diphosphate-sugar epimerase
MSRGRKVLVTGATGHLGTAVCRALIQAGHVVKATDRRSAEGFPAELVLGDLLDEQFVCGLVKGCGAVVHLGNYPNVFAGPSAPQLLAENVRMNANVFFASAESGVKDIVFASSVQVMLKSRGGRRDPPYALPYLPLDGNAPRDPGTNAYAISKEVGERILSALCGDFPDLCATSLRYPMLPRAQRADQLRQMRFSSPEQLNLGECATHLLLGDAGSLVEKAISHRKPGYRQYFPAWSIQFRDLSVQELYRRYFAHVPLRCPNEQLVELVDLSDLKRDLAWEPTDRIVVELDQPLASSMASREPTSA